MPKRHSPLGDILAEMHTVRTPIGLPPLITQLRTAYRRNGSWRATAQALGVSESTLRGWRSGTQKISEAKREAVSEYTRANRRQNYRTSVQQIQRSKLSLPFEYNNKGQVTVGADNLRLKTGTMEAVADALKKGDRKGAATAFVAGIGDNFYRAKFGSYDARIARQEAAAPAAREAATPATPAASGPAGVPDEDLDYMADLLGEDVAGEEVAEIDYTIYAG
jgi:hypothetical protein